MFLNREGITFEEATEKLKEIPLFKRIIEIKVTDSIDNILAEEIRAPFSLPAFRRSGYDGYGILSSDDEDFPKDFQLVEEVGAGSVPHQALQKGQTLRIMTGAFVPDEVGKIIMLEDTHKNGNTVTIDKSSKKDNITPVGSEFEKGEVLLEIGTKINPGVISLLSAFGFEKVKVFDKAKVAILTTGSELLKPGMPYEKGKVYNSNGPLLKALVEKNGGVVQTIGTIEDHLEKTRKQVHKLTKEVDVIITSGGVSVGDFDFMAVLAKESGNLFFNKLKMRPGSPTTAFMKNNVPVFALSGNPGACFTGFYLFVEPFLQSFQGSHSQIEEKEMVILSDYNKKNGFDKYLRGRYEGNNVDFVGSDQSSTLGNLPDTTCLIKVPHDTEITKGEKVAVWILPYKS